MNVYYPLLMNVYYPSLMNVYYPSLMNVYYPSLMNVYYPLLMNVYYPLLMKSMDAGAGRARALVRLLPCRGRPRNLAILRCVTLAALYIHAGEIDRPND